MIVSGRNSRMAAAPRSTVAMDGSGSTSSMICSATLPARRPSTSSTLSTKPRRVIVGSVTIVTRWMSAMSSRYRMALGSK